MHAQAIYINKWIRAFVFVLVSLVLTACGGGNDFDTPEPVTDTTPPTVESFYPNDDFSENFEVDFDIEITFSELMNLESLNSESGITLYSGKSDIDSEFDIEERLSNISFSIVPVVTTDIITDQEIITPATKANLSHASGRFALNTDYTVIVDNPARDLVEDDLSTPEDERNFISSRTTIDFTTEEGEWKQSKAVPNVVLNTEDPLNPFLQNVSQNQFSPRLIANSKGDTFLVWRQELSAGVNQLWVSRYLNDSKDWGTINTLDDICAGDLCTNSMLVNDITATSVLDYDVSINEKGHLAIAWSQASAEGEFVSIWATLYDGKIWTPISEISSTGLSKIGNSDSPSIKLDDSGNAVSIWREQNGQYSRIKANVFKPGAGNLISSGVWVEAPISIDSHSQVVSKNPNLSINSNGFAIAVWEQSSSGLFQIYSNHIRLNQSNNWLGAEMINNISSLNPEFGIGNSSLPSIAVDENNDAIAVWLKHDGQRNNVWFNRFSGSWGELSNYLEDSRLGDASNPGITIGKNNRALAYWIQEDNAGNDRSLFTSFFTAFSGWENRNLIAADNTLTKPVAHFDREGNAIIMWQEGLIRGDINTRYYSKLTDNWNNETTIDQSGADLTLSPLLEDGRFLSIWVDDQSSDYRLKSALFSD